MGTGAFVLPPSVPRGSAQGGGASWFRRWHVWMIPHSIPAGDRKRGVCGPRSIVYDPLAMNRYRAKGPSHCAMLSQGQGPDAEAGATPGCGGPGGMLGVGGAPGAADSSVRWAPAAQDELAALDDDMAEELAPLKQALERAVSRLNDAITLTEQFEDEVRRAAAAWPRNLRHREEAGIASLCARRLRRDWVCWTLCIHRHCEENTAFPGPACAVMQGK